MMKKFLLRCTALFLLLAAAIYIGGVLLRGTTYWKNLERSEDTERFHEVPETVTFAVFGPSHTRYAFRDADWGEGFFNFAMSAQTPQYDLMQMREFGDRIAPGATVVLTMTYFSPFWTDSEEAFAEKQERYYRILSPENIVEIDPAHWRLGRFSPLLTTSVSNMLGAFFKPEALGPTHSDMNGYRVFTGENLDEERVRIAENQKGLWSSFPDGNPVQEQAIDEMLSLCREKGWNAVLLTTPYLQVYNDCFPDEVYEVVREKTRALADAYGVPWLDYSHDPDFADKFEYYFDIDHLNYDGDAAFAAKLQPALRELGLWE